MSLARLALTFLADLTRLVPRRNVDPPRGGAPDIPYRRESSLDLNRAAAQSFQGTAVVLGDADVIQLIGKCPMCRHDMGASINTNPILAPSSASPGQDIAPPRPVRLVLDCQCQGRHSDPDAKAGCGRCWAVLAMWTRHDPTVQLTPDSSVPHCDEAEALRAFNKDELERVRNAAENWRVGLAGLLTLTTTVAFVKGRESISALETVERVLVGLFLAAALVMAAWAAILAMRAAYGPLRRGQLGQEGLVGLLITEANTALDRPAAPSQPRRRDSADLAATPPDGAAPPSFSYAGRKAASSCSPSLRWIDRWVSHAHSARSIDL